MFNIGFGEMLILAAIALIFIGPKQLPEVARIVGRTLNELKRATEDLTGNFVKQRNSFDNYIRNTEKEISQKIMNLEGEAKAEPKVDQSQSSSTVEPERASENKEPKT